MNKAHKMNLTETNGSHKINLTETNGYKLYSLTSEINFYVTICIIVFGLISNLLTIYILNTKPRSSKKQYRLSYRNRPGGQLHSFSSSQCYMLALAVSDSLFLFSHLIEDSLPAIGEHYSLEFMQIINQSNFTCKFILFMRNSARTCSSYLVVCFAYERFIVIKSPLNRLKFHNKKLTKISISLIYVCSFVVNIHSVFINGLRHMDGHEFRDGFELSDEASLPSNKLECDVLNEMKDFYDYTVCMYVVLGIIVPILLVCYFNIYITRVLLTRKNRMLRHFFLNFATPSTSNDAQLSPDHQHENETIEKRLSLPRARNLSINSNNLDKKHWIQLTELRAGKKQPPQTRQEKVKIKKYEKSKKSISFGKESVLSAVDNHLLEQLKKDDEVFSIPLQNGESPLQQHQHQQQPCAQADDEPVSSKLVDENVIARAIVNNHSHSHQNNKRSKSVDLNQLKNRVNLGSVASQYSGLSQKLKDSGRATIILIVISAFFVILNLPYIAAWFSWFIPYKLKTLANEEDIYFRYSIIKLVEILHILNFSINLFLYCMASKLFRSELFSRLNVFKAFTFKFYFRANNESVV
jgi:hypothetical protein